MAKGRGRSKKKDMPVEPTKELQRRVTFRLEDITKSGQVTGQAYKRRPWFETLAARGDITVDQLQALRFYRSNFERQHYSETRCVLNRDPGGGAGDGPSVALVNARWHVRELEAAAGALVDVLRAIAIHDLHYSDVAMATFGSRKQRWIKVELDQPFVEKIVPKSSEHPRRIKAEFIEAVERILPVAEPHYSTKKVA